MRFYPGWLLVCVAAFCGGALKAGDVPRDVPAAASAAPTAPATIPEDTEIARAKEGIEKLRVLVAAGAAPRVQLEKAEAAMLDAEDSAILRRTLYGQSQELTEDQANEMLAAAQRRFERRQKDVDNMRKLVDAGVATQPNLTNTIEALDIARKEYDLAVSRERLSRELTEMARTEHDLQTEVERLPSGPHPLAERYDGNGYFNPQEFLRIEGAFESRFGKPLPVSAMGETAVHRALGFDHRGRVDVAIHPDQPEGVWLREYLTENHIPYFAFRQAVPGKATGAHIHIGPMSTRIAKGG